VSLPVAAARRRDVRTRARPVSGGARHAACGFDRCAMSE